VASATSQGFASDLDAKLAAGVRSGLLWNVHAVLVARHGRLVAEYYGTGQDHAWGRDLGNVTFRPNTLHDLRSVTKSVTGLLYGIARDRGQVPPPEANLLAQFPEYKDLATDAGRAALTVNNALTLTMGTAWNENYSYLDPRNSEAAMEHAPDRLRYVLTQEQVAAPGSKWIYSGGAVALVGALIVRGTGMSLEAFAQQALFAPLGITECGWNRGEDGVASAASGLRLRPRDLLRIGQLVLAGGQWGWRQVVSRAWLEAATRPAIATGPRAVVPPGAKLEYGRLWFLGEISAPALPGAHRWIAGFGNGGQRLWVLPDAELVVVSLSGAYNQPDTWITPWRIWRDIVLKNLAT
jgi:CubicO group peptidase (beta-lactamase class C family)